MRILIMYDIDTKSSSGVKRLQKIASKCLDIGIRIQDSVYECSLDAKKYRETLLTLNKMIDTSKDSLRFYNLGNKAKGKIIHYGIGNTDVFDNFIF